MLNPFAIATLGIGFKPSVCARLGLWPIPPREETVTIDVGSFGGVSPFNLNQRDRDTPLEQDLIEFLMMFVIFRRLTK